MDTQFARPLNEFLPAASSAFPVSQGFGVVRDRAQNH